jgi:hypothetical protein
MKDETDRPTEAPSTSNEAVRIPNSIARLSLGGVEYLIVGTLAVSEATVGRFYLTLSVFVGLRDGSLLGYKFSCPGISSHPMNEDAILSMTQIGNWRY